MVDFFSKRSFTYLYMAHFDNYEDEMVTETDDLIDMLCQLKINYPQLQKSEIFCDKLKVL